MDSFVKESLLFDYYGSLLTEKKRRVLELYHEENLTLAEIAEEFGISRAAVYDSLKSARKQLAEYEEKLGLVAQRVQREQAIEAIAGLLERIEKTHAADTSLKQDLKKVRRLTAEL